VIDNVQYAPPVLLKALAENDPALLYTGLPSRQAVANTRPAKPRDLEILSALQTGATYAEVGDRFGVSRQRIKQIVDLLVSRGYSVPHALAVRQDRRAEAQEVHALARYGASADELAASPELRNYLTARLTRLKARAGRLGIPFSLTASDLYPLPSHCPVLGIPLVYQGGAQGALDDYLSVDRIVPELGYTPENTVLVSARANRLKNNATLDEIQKLAAFYRADRVKTLDNSTNKA
jgi:hypothetical protein